MSTEHTDTQKRSTFALALEKWLRCPTFRDERRYLEQETNLRVLLDEGCFQLLEKLISTSTTQSIRANIPYNTAEFHEQKREELKREKARSILKQYYAILQDIRRRGGDRQAVEDTYINTHGGLTVVELPPLLQEVQEKIEALRPAAKDTSAQDRDECRKLLKHARNTLNGESKLEQYAQVKSVTRVELLLQLISIPPLRTDDAAFEILNGAPGAYTRQKYPIQYARVQRMLGNARVELFNKDNRKVAELARAITHYQNALSIYAPSEHLQEQTMHVQANLLDTHSLLLLFSQAQKSIDELIADVFELEDKLAWTTTENSLHRKIGEVCGNAKARISYALVQHKSFAQATTLLERGCQWRQYEYNEFISPFSHETLEGLTQLEAVVQNAAGSRQAHAVLYLAATLRGGFAAIVSGNQPSSAANFTVVDIPALTHKAVNECMERTIVLTGSPDPRVAGGFAHALNRSGNALFNTWSRKTFYEQLCALRDTNTTEWAEQRVDSEQPATQILLQAIKNSLNALSNAGHWKPLYDQLFPDQLSSLQGKETVGPSDNPKNLMQAAEETFNNLIASQREQFAALLNEHFLRLEIQHIFATFRDILRPLIETIVEMSKAGIQQVTLIPYGSLAALPLASILETSISNDRRIGDLVSLSILPSAQTLLYTQSIAPTPPRSSTQVYTLGDPLPSSKPSRRWSQAHALILKEEANRLSAGSAVAKIRTNATKKWFKKALQEGFMVEAGCYCTLNIDAPLQSKLLLANDEELVLQELLPRANPARPGSILASSDDFINVEGLRLFIIASCQMKIKGERDLYDEAQSFSGVLLQSGVKAIFASYWNVSDEATFLLLRYFAQKWLPDTQKKSPTRALYEAKLALSTVTNAELVREALSLQERLREDDITNRYVTEFNIYRAYEHIYAKVAANKEKLNERPYADPIYWAGFQLFGW